MMETIWNHFDRVVVFDTETTGIEFGTDRIIELVPQLMCEVKTMLKNKNEKEQAKRANAAPPPANPQPNPQAVPQA